MKNFLKGIAAKLRNRKTDDIKVGDTVEIITSVGHFFEIGSSAVIDEVDRSGDSPFVALGKQRKTNSDIWQVLSRKDFRKVENAKTPKKPINRVSLFITLFLAVCSITVLFVPIEISADIAKILLVIALGLGIGVAFIMVIDPSTNEFCKSVDDANSLPENEDEWLGM